MLVLNSSHIWWRSHFEPIQILESAFICLLEHIFLRQFLKPLLTNQWDVSFCFPLNFLLAYIVDELWTSKNLFFLLYPQVQTFVKNTNLSKPMSIIIYVSRRMYSKAICSSAFYVWCFWQKLLKIDKSFIIRYFILVIRFFNSWIFHKFKCFSQIPTGWIRIHSIFDKFIVNIFLILVFSVRVYPSCENSIRNFLLRSRKFS